MEVAEEAPQELDGVGGDVEDVHVEGGNITRHEPQPLQEDHATNEDEPIEDECLVSDNGADNKAENDGQGEGNDTNSDSNDTSGAQGNDTGGRYMPPPLKLNYDALKHIATYFMPGSHGACTDITHLKGGTFHEIRILHSEDGWTCIARFPRLKESLYKVESELATTEYVRKHTNIPVPETFFVNHNRNHVVGSEFVLMERLNGIKLCDVYDGLSLEHKIAVIEQLADMVAQLSELQFGQIGSLNSACKVGPLLNPSRGTYEAYPDIEGPLNTVWEFMCAGLNEKRLHRSQTLMKHYPEIKEHLQPLVAALESSQSLQPPYRLVHSDLQLYNILVTHEDKTQPPKITGIIDWDWAYVGPLYYLFEYPKAITGNVMTDKEDEENKIVRKHFVKALAQHFPKGSTDREMVRRCFREKSDYITLALRYFVDWMNGDTEEELGCTRGFLKRIRGDYGPDFPHHPYGCIEDWEPDSDLECDDE
ncbi:hypothetical protein Q7P37_010208 [Cladosporium fusiforme]